MDAEGYEVYEEDADDAYDATDQKDDHVREQATAVLLPWYHATACPPPQGCSCDLAREDYAAMPTAGLTFAVTECAAFSKSPRAAHGPPGASAGSGALKRRISPCRT